MTISNRLPDGLEESTILKLQESAVASATAVLTARRYLPFEGPLGGGHTSFRVGQPVEVGLHGVQVNARKTLPIPQLSCSFELAIADVEAAQQTGVPLVTKPCDDAAERLAMAEESLIYYGASPLGIDGLCTVAESSSVTLTHWRTPDEAVRNIISGVDRMDAEGRTGAYALILSPRLYNALFLKYEGSDVLALDHLRRLANAGIFKCQVLDESALIVAGDVGAIMCTEDLSVRFLDTTPSTLRFVVSSSLVLRIDEPTSACVLREVRGSQSSAKDSGVNSTQQHPSASS